jgi:hypothetical protein
MVLQKLDFKLIFTMSEHLISVSTIFMDLREPHEKGHGCWMFEIPDLKQAGGAQ